MATADEADLAAVLLPADEAAVAIRRAWDRGQAVLPLDPEAPHHELATRLARMRPTLLVDRAGASRRPDGVPVLAGTAAVVATSGTEGEPKGAVLTRAGMEHSGRSVDEALEVERDDRWLCCLPLHHVAGLAVLGRACTSGLPVTVQVGFDAGAVAAAAGTTTLVSLVPTMLRRLLDAGAPVDRFRRILLGGGPAPGALVERTREVGAAVVTTYGQTETWGGVVHDGHALRGLEVRIDDRDEIVLRTPAVMAGYRLDPAGTAAVLGEDGWLHTGDAGRLATDGRLTVVDRLRDVVITGGVNVSPSEVEAELARHPGVAEVCVIGAPDLEWGERVVAAVVPHNPADPPTLDALRAFARDRLAAAKLPREILLVEAVPRTTVGKPRRRVLRERLTGMTGRPGAR